MGRTWPEVHELFTGVMWQVMGLQRRFGLVSVPRNDEKKRGGMS